MSNLFSTLPSVDQLLTHPTIIPLLGQFGHTATVKAIRAELAEVRAGLRTQPDIPVDPATVAVACAARMQHLASPSLQPVYNLTGTILHTNLGRALLSRQAAQAVQVAREILLDGADLSRFSGSLVHVHMFLAPKAGATPIAFSSSVLAARCSSVSTLI